VTPKYRCPFRLSFAYFYIVGLVPITNMHEIIDDGRSPANNQIYQIIMVYITLYLSYHPDIFCFGQTEAETTSYE